MKKNEMIKALEPMLAPRIHAIVQDDLGNGTPIADAVATVLAVDIALRGKRFFNDAKTHIGTLTDEQIKQTIHDLELCFTSPNSSVSAVLPFGTRIESSWQSGVKIGNHHYHALRERPGLHETGVVGDLGRPGAELLKQKIAQKLAELPKCDIPRPGVDDIKIETQWRYRDTIHLPMRGGPGTTYTHSENIMITEFMLDDDIEDTVSIIFEKSLDAIEHADEIDAEYTKLLTSIQPILDKASKEDIYFRFAGVVVSFYSSKAIVRPKFEVLGNDLKPTSWEASTHGAGGVMGAIKNQISLQRRRKRVLDEAGSAGARGRVDQITLRAIEEFWENPAAALKQMAGKRSITVNGKRNGAKNDPIRIVWRNGRIESNFMIKEGITWNYTRLVLKNFQLPATVINSLPGKPLSVVIEHPLLQGDHKIRSVTTRGTWTFINMDLEWTVFDSETGEQIEKQSPDEDSRTDNGHNVGDKDLMAAEG